MSLINYLKTQFLEIIQWQDDSRDTISFRYPDMQKEIKRGAQLIVRESQVAQFVYEGQFGDTFGPGTHSLVTANIPILSDLKGWKYGFESPFKADVYFVNTRLFTGNKWGTANPIMMRDPDFGMVRVRAYGIYDFHVVDVKLFLKEVAGTDAHFRLDEFGDTMRSRIVSVFTEAVALDKVPVLDVAARYEELGEALLPVINPAVTSKYGLEISSFIVENVSLPPEVEQSIDKRSSMAAWGTLMTTSSSRWPNPWPKGKAAVWRARPPNWARVWPWASKSPKPWETRPRPPRPPFRRLFQPPARERDRPPPPPPARRNCSPPPTPP